jgi:hypothetical protein
VIVLLGLVGLALQTIPAALYRADELRQVHFKRVEDVVRVVLGTETNLALA